MPQLAFPRNQYTQEQGMLRGLPMLSLPKKIGYSIGRFGPTLLMTMITISAFYVYGTSFQLNWILNGISLALSYIVIGLTHWTIGYYSDSLKSK